MKAPNSINYRDAHRTLILVKKQNTSRECYIFAQRPYEQQPSLCKNLELEVHPIEEIN